MQEEFGDTMININDGNDRNDGKPLKTLENTLTAEPGEEKQEKPEQVEAENIFNPSTNSSSNPEEQKMENVENTSEQEIKKEQESSSSYIDKLLCIFRFIKPYFKVTFNDIKARIISSFKPIKEDFIKIAEDKPDLYGPFWIYTTLIYVIAAGGALSYYFTNSANNYFQMFVPVAGSILYSFGFGFPLVLWLCMKFFNISMKYVSLICLYGYSLFCLIPVLIICSTGFGWIQWIFLTYAIVNSTAFVLINLWSKIKTLEDKNKYIFLGIFIGGQLILFLILKFYFFGSFKGNVAPISNDPNVINNNPNPNVNPTPPPAQ